MAKARRKTETRLLVPVRVRDRCTRFSVCADVKLGRKDLARLWELGKASEGVRKFTLSQEGDPNVAVTFLRPKKRGLVHVTIEFRHARSPYPEVPKKRMGQIVRLLNASEDKRLVHSSMTTAHALPEHSVSPLGPEVKLTGFDYEHVDPPQGDRAGARVDLQDDRLDLTVWVGTSRPLASLAKVVQEAAKLGFRTPKELP